MCILSEQQAPRIRFFFMWVASMSLCENGAKGLLVGPSLTQGPKGWWGSSGSQGLKTSERGRNTEIEEEKQRWAEMGRMAGRQTAGEFFCFFLPKKKRKNDRRKHKIQWRL